MPLVTTSADIGSAIAAARKSRQLTQAKLAALAGTTQAVVSQIEHGKETAQLSIVLALIAAAGLRIDISAPAGTAQLSPEPVQPGKVIFDEPLPDDSIDLDAIVGGLKPKTSK